MTVDFSLLAAGILMTYALTFLFSELAGPFDILARFRTLVGVRFDEHSRRYGTNVVAELLVCFYCTSFWMAAIIALALHVPVVYLLAFAGGASVLRKAYG